MTDVGATYRKLAGKAESERYTVRQTEDWATLNWRKLEANTARLQRRIYRAKRCGDVKRVHNLQRLLLRSLLKRQRGRCKYCGALFMTEDIIELHHKNRDRYDNSQRNLELLHGHCHDRMHAAAATADGIADNNHFAEEPCARKPASTVLKQREER